MKHRVWSPRSTWRCRTIDAHRLGASGAPENRCRSAEALCARPGRQWPGLRHHLL